MFVDCQFRVGVREGGKEYEKWGEVRTDKQSEALWVSLCLISFLWPIKIYKLDSVFTANAF